MKNFLKKFSGLEKKIKNATISKRSSQIESLEDGEDEYDASTEDELEEDEEYEESEEEESGEENSKEWLQKDFEEGQLSIDVFQTPDKLIVKSTIAGVKPEDIDNLPSVNRFIYELSSKKYLDITNDFFKEFCPNGASDEAVNKSNYYLVDKQVENTSVLIESAQKEIDTAEKVISTQEKIVSIFCLIFLYSCCFFSHFFCFLIIRR